MWNTGISFFVCCVLWRIFLNREFNFSYAYDLDIDFLNTLLGSFTVVGFAIAVYQISELRTETEIETDTIDKIYLRWFIHDSIPKFENVRIAIENLETKITAAQVFSQITVDEYINDISIIIKELNERKSHQNAALKTPIIDCEICLTLLNEMLNECDRINSAHSYNLVKKFFFKSRLTILSEKISDCENKLKF